METRPTRSRWHGPVLAGFISLAGGCFHTQGVVVPPPPDGSVPTELNKVVLPRYVIEAPDVLLVQVLVPPEHYFKPPRGSEAGERPPATGTDKQPATGAAQPPNIANAPNPAGLPAVPEDALKYFSAPLSPSPIDGNHLVQMDGTIDLGIYGSVPVAGMNIDQAREQVRAFIARVSNRNPEAIQVRVSVAAYNSKQFYVITDGAGYGEQVYPLPITGSETVLDAIGRIGGLPQVSSKRDMWVARRSPAGSPDQILPVCWEEITQQGITRTNYQVLPGDRIYVRAQKIISFDNALAKILQPIERVLGVILLGSETVIFDPEPDDERLGAVRRRESEKAKNSYGVASRIRSEDSPMARHLFFLTTALLATAGSAAAQYPYPYQQPGYANPPGGIAGPPLSPYLNLLNGGNPAVNYYNFVRPQLALQQPALYGGGGGSAIVGRVPIGERLADYGLDRADSASLRDRRQPSRVHGIRRLL